MNMNQELIDAFLSRNVWTMIDFCTQYDCDAEVFLELSNRFQGVDRAEFVDSRAFLNGFIHDELANDINNFENVSLTIQQCRVPFYRCGASGSLDLNSTVLRHIGHFLWSSDVYENNFRNLVFTRIFSFSDMLGKAMGNGFASLRNAGASQELIERGKELVSLRDTVGNIIALPRGRVGDMYFIKYLTDHCSNRFDLLLDKMLYALGDGDSEYRNLINANQWYFNGGVEGFLANHVLDSFRTDMGDAFGMEIFHRDESQTDAHSYLLKAEKYIDAAIKTIRSRSQQIVSLLGKSLKDA